MSRDREKGDETESKTDRALQILIKEWDEIVSYHHNRQNGELDALHIDFLIILRSRFIFPLQIKSSARGARQHIKKHPYIVVMAVRRGHTERHIADRIKSLILRHYKNVASRH